MITDSVTQQIKDSIEQSLKNTVTKRSTGVPSSIIRDVIAKASEETSSFISSGVITNTNEQLDTIPKNLIGLKNPVNITNKNTSSTDLASNLDNIIKTKISQPAISKLISVVNTELKNALPPNAQNLLKLNAIASALEQSINSTVEKSISDTLGAYTDSIFNNSRTPTVNVTNIDLFFSDNPEQALDNIDQQYSSYISNQALAEAEKFDLNNEDNVEKLTVLNQGFSDPTANYPTTEYKDIPETNKLAQGDARGTVVQKKNLERMTGAKLPYGEAWDQPESPFKGEYPYNKVTQTESGHIIEVDDTPGSERLHIYHRSGTFIEIDANGSVVKRAVGSSYEIIDRNGKIAIAGRADISVNGACNIFVGNDANIEVEGDTNITCHNDITAQAGGTLNLSATEEINITSDKINIQAYSEMNLKSDNDLKSYSKNNYYVRSGADILTQSTNSYEKYSESKFIETGDEVNVQASGNFNLDADRIYLNSDTSSPSKESEIAGSSNIGIMPGRKDITPNIKVDPLFLTLADTKSILLEEEGQTGTDYKTQKDLIITSGFADAAEIEAAPVTVERSDVETAQTNVVQPDERLKVATELPGNYNLSPNFTVEMLSNKAAVTKDKIEATTEMRYGDIVYNLQAVALNILEPVLKLYPNMFVTSAYRSPKNQSNSKTSQHPMGQAVDLQFKGISKTDYYVIAQKLGKVLNYDQLILEYCNYTNNPWIHISFSLKNRNQVLTFFNHKKHSDGLTQLA